MKINHRKKLACFIFLLAGIIQYKARGQIPQPQHLGQMAFCLCTADFSCKR